MELVRLGSEVHRAITPHVQQKRTSLVLEQPLHLAARCLPERLDVFQCLLTAGAWSVFDRGKGGHRNGDACDLSVILVITWVASLKKVLTLAVTLFLLPPSLQDLTSNGQTVLHSAAGCIPDLITRVGLHVLADVAEALTLLDRLRPLLTHLVTVAPEHVARQDDRDRVPLAVAIYFGHIPAVDILGRHTSRAVLHDSERDAPAAPFPVFARGDAWPWPEALTKPIQIRIRSILMEQGHL